MITNVKARPTRLYKVIDVATSMVVYVGISDHPWYRLKCHRNSWDNPELKVFLKSRPKNMVALLYDDPTDDENALRDLEKRTIAFYKSNGQAMFNRQPYFIPDECR